MALFGLKQNANKLDRGLRLAIGLCLMVVAAPGTELLGGSIFQLAIFLFGVLNIVTAVLGWCPVYQMAKISSISAPNDFEN